ncbi:MAG: hypothetical protein J5685_08650 [Clostridiales bacterium]|nr:hypothetical protein [Clostridiales bacterium]
MTDKKLTDKILYVVLTLCTLGVLISVLWSLRHILLCCSDSLAEYIFARAQHNFKWSFDRGMDFCLSRGRLGVIFPFVTAVRHLICMSGNYMACWLMQHLPVYLNVFLLSFIIGRRTKASYGLIFALSFLSFLQINGWHNLMICYPLDFMYGLFLCILALWLFQISMETKKKAVKIITRGISAWLFYESMQTYEAFLFISAVYAWLALCFHLKKNGFKKGAKGKARLFIRSILHSAISLIPHFITAVAYLGIYVYIHAHPIVEDTGNDLSTMGTFPGFVETLTVFSGGMFPMSNLLFPAVRIGTKSVGITSGMILRTVLAGIGILCAAVLIYRDKERGKHNRTLRVMAVAGIIGAVLFPAMHAATERYQGWVINEHQFGYVPTAICYYGWIVAASCIMGLVLNAASKKKVTKAIFAFIGFAGFTVCTLVTCMINQAIIDTGVGPANPNLSLRAQTYYALTRDMDFRNSGCDVLYLNGFSGVHGFIGYDELIIAAEFQGTQRPMLTFSAEEAEEMYAGASNPCEFRYDFDSYAGSLVPSNGDGDIRIVSATGGSYRVDYTETDGDHVTFDVTLLPWSSYLYDAPETFDAESIDIGAIS